MDNNPRTDLVCLNCGNVFTIYRSYNYKKVGHIKDLWCYSCKKVTKHYEVRDISKFMYDIDTPDIEKQKVIRLVLKRRENDGQ